jgi:hypothetical protein
MEDNETTFLVHIRIRELNTIYNFNVISTDTIGPLKEKVLKKLINDYNFIDFTKWTIGNIFRVGSKDFTNDNDLIKQDKFSYYFEMQLVKK